ncbi:MAG: DUF3175 domain-containing protein [Hyphomicrobiaceae bacterium]
MRKTEHKRPHRTKPGRSRARAKTNYWSGAVTQSSDALDLEADVFTWKDPARIARSLKKSAEASDRRKASPFQSAMSMLTFFINRAGHSLPDQRRQVLEKAKVELRRQFGRA